MFLFFCVWIVFVCVCIVFVWASKIIRYVVGFSTWDVGQNYRVKVNIRQLYRNKYSCTTNSFYNILTITDVESCIYVI